MKISEKQIAALLATPGPKRYEHFIKTVADQELVWVLEKEDGWAVMTLDDGSLVLPMWPAEEYAALCAKDGWSGFSPESIDLERFLTEVLPDLEAESMIPAVFYVSSGQAPTPTLQQLKDDLLTELEKYG